MKKLTGILFFVFILSGFASFKASGQDLYDKDLFLENLEGDSLKIDKFKGKIVVIDIWGVWCAPCIAEIPALNRLKKEYEGDTNLVFLALSKDPRKYTEEFLEKTTYSFYQAFDRSDIVDRIAGKYFSIFPTHAILDKNGKVVFKKRGGSHEIEEILTAKIEELRKN